MNFLKPLHLFEVYIFETTKKNAFSIMNSEPTSTVRKKVYADKYEVTGGALTFYQTVKNASDELEAVPVISFPPGKWESVSLIRNKVIIAENRTGASTGATHLSIQSELKKNENTSSSGSKPVAPSNSFKIIQMPPQGQDTTREMAEINKLLEFVNKLVESQKEVLDKVYEMPMRTAKYFEQEVISPEPVTQPIKVADKTAQPVVAKKETPAPKVIETPKEKEPEAIPSLDFEDLNSLPIDETPTIFPTEDAPKYSKEEIESVSSEDDPFGDLDDFNNLDDSSETSMPEEEPIIHELPSGEIDDFNIDIDSITASLDDTSNILGVEVPDEKPVAPVKKETKAVVKEELTPEPVPAVDENDNLDIMGLLDTLSDDTPAISKQEMKEKKKEFIITHLKSYIKLIEIFRFDRFHEYLKNEDEYKLYGTKESDVEWEISQALLHQKIAPNKFSTEKTQKHLNLLIPSIMKKYWDGNIIPILDHAREHNEIKDITLVDLAVWLAQHGYK